VAPDETPLEVRGPTLTLRYPTAADVPAVFELARDPEVTRFFSWGPYEAPHEAAAYIASLPAKRERGEALDLLVVRQDHGPVGHTGLSELARRDRRAVIGSWFGRAFWGSGANPESKALMTRLAFETLGLERLSAYASTENPRSQRALEKVGFRLEGTLRGWHRHGSTVHDVNIYALLREEWAGSPLARVPVEVHGAPPDAWLPA
jgi:ribosomal-protein-alanine N-acetyltransferase